MKQIVLASRPKGSVTKENFRFQEISIHEPGEDEVLLQPLFFSVDPYMRGRMNAGKSYVAPFEVDKPIAGGAVARVLLSRDSQLQAGELVLGSLPWQEKSVLPAKELRKIDVSQVPASWYLGILGMPGLTAYFGLLDIGKPKAGETVLVSGAAGAVGTVVGQLAKIHGCRVVGIAGSDEKVKLLQGQFGYDAVINYKTATNLKEAIREACPEGVDVYFDNVGAEITDAAISCINFFSRIVLCGQIALYNEKEVSTGPRFLPIILTRSALVQGFIVSNYSKRFPEAFEAMAGWVKAGRLQYKETFVEGFDALPEAFLGLFSGKNIGKMLVKVG